eukprot:scpid39200/ scgid11049/ Importin subunit alpha-4; Importin alpha Q1; Karyopherin subunit alpha-4
MAEGRMKQFKHKGKDDAELRRKRTEERVELRKTKRSDELAKRRHVPEVEADEADDFQQSDELPISSSFMSTATPDTILAGVSKGIVSSDFSTQLSAVVAIRRLLSTHNRTSTYEEVLRYGYLPILVQLLERSDQPMLQYEAAWCLTNIASGTSEQTMAIVNNGAIVPLITLIDATPHLSTQALWTLGNIAGDSTVLRDHVIKSGILDPLIKCIYSEPPISLRHLRLVSWVMSNLCRYNQPSPPLEAVLNLLPLMKVLICHEDVEVCKDVCWSLSFLSDGNGDDSLVKAVIASGIVQHLVQMLGKESSAILVPALRAVGNLATGTETQTQLVLDNGALQFFPRLLECKEERVKKEASWALSNITAGTPAQIADVAEAQLLPILIKVFTVSEYVTKREAAWAIANFAIAGLPQQLAYFVECGGLALLCELLVFRDVQVIKVALNAILAILRAAGDHFEQLAIAFEEGGACHVLEQLQLHENTAISDMAAAMIDEFFSSGADVVEQTGPVASAAQYQFGMQAVPDNFSIS